MSTNIDIVEQIDFQEAFVSQLRFPSLTQNNERDLNRTQMSLVACELPKAGLGNQLFPLMKAYTFAAINRLPVVVINYNRLTFGPYLRGERSKRVYRNYFTFQKNAFLHQLDKWKVSGLKRFSTAAEPSIKSVNDKEKKQLYTFGQIPHWSNYFDGLKEQRGLLKELLFKLISPSILEEVATHPVPEIGVHIRMGDFRKLKEGEDFAATGAVRTPEEYFIDMIRKVRSIHGQEMHVSVFTDGYASEFKELLSLDNVSLIKGNKDIIDLVLLSKSKIIISSAGSTFSYWAGFLSDSPIILHPDHIHSRIRAEQDLFEGTVDDYQSHLASIHGE